MDKTTHVKRCDSSQLKTGDRLSRIQYYEVVSIDEEKNQYQLKNQQGFEFIVTPGIVEAEMFSADQFTSDVKVTRSELVSILESAGDTCFTVTFMKQTKDKDIADRLKDIDMSEYTSDRARRKLARELIAGEERVLRGYLQSTEPKLGRSMVIDLAIPEGRHNIRLVDHRTIKSIVLKNVRYHCD